jgi:hypothetical protein
MMLFQSFFNRSLFLFSCFLLTGMNPLLAQIPDTLPNTNRVYDSQIKTVLLHKDGFEMSAPVMNMNTGARLKLSFDVLGF